MSHNLHFDLNQNRFAMFSTQAEWHHGETHHNISKYALTSREAIIEAALDYTVASATPLIKIPNKEILGRHNNMNSDQYIPLNKGAITYRTDTNTPFGYVGDRYEIVQNVDVFNFMDSIIESKLAIFESAGALGNGETIFITVSNIDGDEMIPYLVLTTSHDGTGSITALITNVRVVCQNTLNAALSENTNKISFRHTKNIKQAMNQGAALLNLTSNYIKESEQALTELSHVAVNDVIIKDVVNSLILSDNEIKLLNQDIQFDISTRKSNLIDDMINHIHTGRGQDVGANGTALHLLNGITSYYSNGVKYKDFNHKFKSLNSGRIPKQMQKAYNLVSNLI